MPRNRNQRSPIALLTGVSLLVVVGSALAQHKTYDTTVDRDGREKRINVIMSVPYGALSLVAGTPTNGQVAFIQTHSSNSEPMPLHVRYTYNSIGATSTLRMTIGSDEGMLQTHPPLAHAWKANTRISPISGGAIHSDYGDINPPSSAFDILSSPLPPISHDDGELAKVFLTRDIPLSIRAQLGFGESNIDLTGLSVTCVYVETGTSKTEIHLHEKNPIPMNGCKINAGFGEFAMDGICFLNSDKFEFSGGVGYYNLNFSGKLPKDMEANVNVGLGRVSINIPPEAARVRIIYDDSYFSSFSFSGLSKRKDGTFTSVGFDQSKAPVLTLKLSSGLGKMVVNYH